jgi:excisionase family DNA binding protein
MRELLNVPEAAKYLRIAPQTLAKMRCEGTSPPFIKLGNRVLYDLAEIDRWLDQRRRRSTSDPGSEYSTRAGGT